MYNVTISEQSNIVFKSRKHLFHMNPMIIPVILILGCNSNRFTLYNTETWIRKLIQIQRLTEKHSLSCERYIRLLETKEIIKPHQSPYDTTASDRRSWALGYQWYTAWSYFRCRNEVNTKFFILIALTKIHRIKSQQNLVLEAVPNHAITIIDLPHAQWRGIFI